MSWTSSTATQKWIEFQNWIVLAALACQKKWKLELLYKQKHIKKQFQTTTTTRKPHQTKQLWNSKNETTLSKLKVDNVIQALDIIATHSLPDNSLKNTLFLSTSFGNRQSFYVSSFFSFRYSQQTSIEHPHRVATSVCVVFAMEQWNRIVF